MNSWNRTPRTEREVASMAREAERATWAYKTNQRTLEKTLEALLADGQDIDEIVYRKRPDGVGGRARPVAIRTHSDPEAAARLLARTARRRELARQAAGKVRDRWLP